MPRPRPVGDHDLMVRAARLAFEFGLTQEHTARQLGVSRIKVTRLLKQARESGIVKITVIGDVGIYSGIEDQLRDAGSLRGAIVTPSASSTREVRRHLGLAAAQYLQRVLRDQMTVAVGVSRTIAGMASNLIDVTPVHARFVSLAGATPDNGGSPFESTQSLATAMGSEAIHLHAPVVVSDPRTARRLVRDPAIAGVLDLASRADLALVGVGGIHDRLVFPDGDYFTVDELDHLRALGAVGDIGGQFFDQFGMAVPGPVYDRVIGLTLEQFSRIPTRVMVGAGTDKVAAIAAALRGSLATVLITDLNTAQEVLAELDDSD